MKIQEIVKEYLSVLDINFEIKTLEDITKLIQSHERKLAFSSLKVLLKDKISLELEDIFKSLVLKKRGGYCFEHNKLIYEVLKNLGFDVEFYLARVINNLDNEVPQTHRFTLLNYSDEKYLIDVGIGFRSPCVPIKFSEDETSSHLGIIYKIVVNKDDTYSLCLLEKGKWFKATKFNLQKCYEADFEMGHFYSHKHPCAVFVNNLVLSLITSTEIRSLRNRDYLKIYENYQEKIEIDSIDTFKNILENEFNVNFKFEEIEFLYKKFVENKS